MTSGRQLGAAGESFAASELERRGYRILARNWSGSAGELDLVATQEGDPPTIVFVEVKTRHSADWGHPGEAVDRRKQARIRRTAVEFLEAARQGRGDVRFDVVEVLVERGVARIDHIEDAF